jgi:hypothetical protein
MTATELATRPNNQSIRRKQSSIGIAASLPELWELAGILVRSRMLPNSVATPEAAVAIILKGRELGIGAMAAFAGITVIQGKPVVSPQLMLSLINRDGVLEDLKIEDDGHACRVTMKRHGRSPHTAVFSMDNAREMGLAGKDNWKKMAAVMRQWRAVAACARIVCPDVIDGMYTPEEMGAEVNEDGEIIDGEIVSEATPPPVKSAPGLFTNDHQQAVKRFLEWLGNKCDATNKAWHEAWAGVRDATSDEALQFWPTKIPDAINKFGAKGHLWKWAVRSNLVEGVTEHEGAKPAQVDAFLAKVWIENREAITDEMRRYVGEKKGELEAKIYRDNPDIAPEGYFAENEPRTESQTPLVPDDEDDDAFEEGRE